MKKFFKQNWIVVVLFLLGLSVSWPLFRSGYFSHQDDLQIIRLVEMRKCFSDFQIPCRWVPIWVGGMGFHCLISMAYQHITLAQSLVM
jgi:hypothetical protein